MEVQATDTSQGCSTAWGSQSCPCIFSCKL